MNTVQEIIQEAISLPVEERSIVADSILRSLNPPNEEMEQKWIATSKRRLNELRSGKVKAIPGEIVMEKIKSRFKNDV